MVNGIINFEFQNNCINFLIDKTLETDSKQVITVKAPTGAGKTVMLIKYVDEYLKNTNRKTGVRMAMPRQRMILSSRGMKKMDELTPQRDTRNLLCSMRWVLKCDSVTFINWELVTKKGNTALKEGERANLFEAIAAAHKAGISFIIIIDEEHLNNTKKADDIIRAFSAKNIIRVSATAQKVNHHDSMKFRKKMLLMRGLLQKQFM